MNDAPKVSICVVTYNQEEYIGRCLQSIVDQEADFSFEVIVGDDCSTDGTRDILLKFAERYPGLIKLSFNERNLGCRKNYAIIQLMARGDYVANCDGDDFWLPGKLKWQTRYLDRNPDVAAVFSNAETGRSVKYKSSECGIYRLEKILERVYTHSLCVHSSILERRVDVRRIHEREGEAFDFEWYWLKHRNALIYIDPVVRVHYEQNPNGVSRQKRFVADLEPTLERFRKNGMNAKTMEKMLFDYQMLKYFSDPFNNDRPSFITAIRFGYGIGLLSRLGAPASIYYAIKLIKHPNLKQVTS